MRSDNQAHDHDGVHFVAIAQAQRIAAIRPLTFRAGKSSASRGITRHSHAWWKSMNVGLPPLFVVPELPFGPEFRDRQDASAERRKPGALGDAAACRRRGNSAAEGHLHDPELHVTTHAAPSRPGAMERRYFASRIALRGSLGFLRVFWGGVG